jgi:hypothetical protein
LLLLVVLVGCADDAEPHDPIVLHQDGKADTSAESGVDLCALAAELPPDDICSKACDPQAMAAQLAADGSDRGACYQLFCDLPGEHHVLVGVCLPP